MKSLRTLSKAFFADHYLSACYPEGGLAPSKGLFGGKKLQYPPYAVPAVFRVSISSKMSGINQITFLAVDYPVTVNLKK
jgi:hypothetical protein